METELEDEEKNEEEECRTLVVRAKDGDWIMGDDLVLPVTGDETVVEIQEVGILSTGLQRGIQTLKCGGIDVNAMTATVLPDLQFAPGVFGATLSNRVRPATVLGCYSSSLHRGLK